MRTFCQTFRVNWEAVLDSLCYLVGLPNFARLFFSLNPFLYLLHVVDIPGNTECLRHDYTGDKLSGVTSSCNNHRAAQGCSPIEIGGECTWNNNGSCDVAWAQCRYMQFICCGIHETSGARDDVTDNVNTELYCSISICMELNTLRCRTLHALQ